MRKDPHGNPLPPRLHFKHGAYWYVYRNKWHRLAEAYTDAMAAYGRKRAPQSGMVALLDKVYDRYEKRHSDGELAANTIKQYRGVRSRIETAFSEFQPSQVLTSDVTRFLDFYEDTPNMANRMLTVLKETFDRGVRLGLCDTNPAYPVKRFPEKTRDRYVEDSEFLAIWTKASPVLRLVMDMAYLTGQRIGDVLTLKHSDIQDDGIFFQQEKSGQRLRIQRSADIDQVIHEAKALHRVQTLSEYVFHPRGKTTPYAYHGIKSAFDRARTKAGLPDIVIHDIRAKSLTDAEEQGKDPQRLGGHKNRAVTERYLRKLRTQVAEGPKTLDKS